MIKLLGAASALPIPGICPSGYPDSLKGCMLLRQLHEAYNDRDDIPVALELHEIFAPPIPSDSPLSSVLTNILDCQSPMPSILSLLDSDDDTSPTITPKDLALLMKGVILALRHSFRTLCRRTNAMNGRLDLLPWVRAVTFIRTAPLLHDRLGSGWDGPLFNDVAEQGHRLSEVTATFTFMRWVAEHVRPIAQFRIGEYTDSLDIGDGKVVPDPRPMIWTEIFERVSYGVVLSMACALEARRMDVSVIAPLPDCANPPWLPQMWNPTEIESDPLLEKELGAPFCTIWEDAAWWQVTNQPLVRTIEWKTRNNVWDYGFLEFIESITEERWARLNCHGRAYVFIAVLVAAVQFCRDMKDDPKYWPTVVDSFKRFGDRVLGQ